jgi:ABC-type Fe3+ transport system substrate-binding protein
MTTGRRIPQNTAEYARWLAAEISRRYRDTWFARDTTMFVSMALEGYAELLDSKEATSLTFTVSAFDEFGQSHVIAAANNSEVAWAA